MCNCLKTPAKAPCKMVGMHIRACEPTEKRNYSRSCSAAVRDRELTRPAQRVRSPDDESTPSTRLLRDQTDDPMESNVIYRYVVAIDLIPWYPLLLYLSSFRRQFGFGWKSSRFQRKKILKNTIFPETTRLRASGRMVSLAFSSLRGTRLRLSGRGHPRNVLPRSGHETSRVVLLPIDRPYSTDCLRVAMRLTAMDEHLERKPPKITRGEG